MMSTMPEELLTELTRLGLTGKQEIVYWMVCDRNVNGGFEDTYLVLDRTGLYIVSVEPDIRKGKTFKGFVTLRSRKAGEDHSGRPAYRITSSNKMPLEEIENLSIVELVASGMIVAKTTEEQAIAAFTNGLRKEAGKFVNVFNKLKKGEPIKPEDVEPREEQGSCPKCGMIYPEKGRQVCPRCMKKGAIFLRLLGMTVPYKKTIVLIVLFMLLNSATGLVIPYLSGTVLFDQALGNTGPFAGKLALVILLIIGFRVLSLLFGMAFGILNARMAAKVVFDLKAGIFASLQRLSLAFFQKKQTGQLMTRVNNDATELQYFFVDGISYFVVNALNMLAITVILFAMDWKLTLITFVPLPFVVLLIRWVFPKLGRLSWRRYKRTSALNSVISDTVRGTRVVKAFGKEQQEIQRFGRVNMAFAHVEQQYNKMNNTVFPMIWMITQLGGILVWAFGGWQVMYGNFTFGNVMTFINYLGMLYGPIQFMNNIASWWSYCMTAAQRIFEIQDAVPDIEEKPDAVHLEHIRGEIVVDNITFGYEANKPILKQVSLHAKPGQMIGVVGPSGAGKSTLVNLISRLYDVNEGEIRIDGVNVKDLSMRTLRDNIGIVSQEVYVFMGTIAENIAYAKPDCTMEEIIQAAKIAKAHDFIEQLPDGYDTLIGTGGHSLSGGEKQRLSIARAILHNPKILILDEATASLDTDTELQIQEALETLMKGRTTIAIAHRLSTLRNADYLVVMQKGEIVEEGTHEELMEKQGIYFDMVKKHDEALKMREVV